jgi:hypothetical protein
MEEKAKIELTRSLFWDIEYDRLDFKTHASFIVERVLNRGSIEDFRAIVKYYGKEQLKEITLKIRYLDKKTLSFCSAFFSEPLENFRCYKQKQLNQTHWDY